MKFKTNEKSGLGKDIYLVKFGKVAIHVSNDFNNRWKEKDLFDGWSWSEWLIHRLWYRNVEMNFHTSNEAMCFIHQEWKAHNAWLKAKAELKAYRKSIKGKGV